MRRRAPGVPPQSPLLAQDPRHCRVPFFTSLQPREYGKGPTKEDFPMLSLQDYASHDGLGLADLVARKEVKPEELLEAALIAAEKVNPKINAVLQTLPDQARAAIGQGLPPGPFHGVPFFIK